MAKIKVHGSPISTATMRVTATLYEKELEFEFVSINMRDGGHKKEPFISLNVSNIKIYIILLVYFNYELKFSLLFQLH